MSQFLHGVEVQEITGGPRPIKTVSSSVIGLVGTGTAHADFPLNTPVLVTSPTGVSTKLGATSYLGKAIEAIYKQTGAVVVVVRVAAATDVAGSATLLTGVHALRKAQSELNVTPRLIVAEGAYGTATIDDVKVVASALRAVAIAGLVSSVATIDTATEASAWVTANGNDRMYAVWPAVNGGEDPAPYVAGLMARIDNERGFWWSPSNNEVFGIEKIDKAVDFVLGDTSSLANVLNLGNVATFIRSGGFRLWGNQTGSTDIKYQFVNVRRTADLIFDSLQRAHLWAVDRLISKTYLEDVTESVNAYLASLKNQGAILGGKCWADPDLNTSANIQLGKVYFNFDFSPPYPAEHIVFRGELTNEYLTEILN
jgi:phage tail sheath protein FI